jgi:menaquinone-dependent protoporphyrinogen oxidase
MKVLVAYASRHGATRGIAERIAGILETEGLDVTLESVEGVDVTDGFDAFVIGSAAYMGHWLKEAATFVRRHEATLAGHPVWFFSSGPVGTETITKAGKDILAASEPKEFGEFAQAIPARDQHVFFGAYDPDLKPGSFLERLSNLIPAATSVTGPRSRPGLTGSRSSWRSTARLDSCLRVDAIASPRFNRQPSRTGRAAGSSSVRPGFDLKTVHPLMPSLDGPVVHLPGRCSSSLAHGAGERAEQLDPGRNVGPRASVARRESDDPVSRDKRP